MQNPYIPLIFSKYYKSNIIKGRKYDYRKGDWKGLIQPITNRLCEEYGLSMVAAEYSKDPVNMNRRQWEKEQSWKDFIMGDMQYCRNKAKSFEEFSVQSLQEYYEQPHHYKYVEPPVYQPGHALVMKPKNAFQQRYFGKLYRMCVVQKYRFQCLRQWRNRKRNSQTRELTGRRR